MTKTALSFELFPAKTEKDNDRVAILARRLMFFNPNFISITYGAGGSSQQMNDYLLEKIIQQASIPVDMLCCHITCVDASKSHVNHIIKQWQDLGVRRFLALRGDVPDGRPYTPHADGYANATELTAYMKGFDDMDVSVAGYPEFHPDSPSPQADIDNVKRKIDAGAQRIITQYFFDVDVFLRYRDRIADAGIKVPVIPGILPIASIPKIQRFSQRCGASVPDRVIQHFSGYSEGSADHYEKSVEICAHLCTQLIENDVAGLHIYSLNSSSIVVDALLDMQVQGIL